MLPYMTKNDTACQHEQITVKNVNYLSDHQYKCYIAFEKHIKDHKVQCDLYQYVTTTMPKEGLKSKWGNSG